jgi:hypothetical protein
MHNGTEDDDVALGILEKLVVCVLLEHSHCVASPSFLDKIKQVSQSSVCTGLCRPQRLNNTLVSKERRG